MQVSQAQLADGGQEQRGAGAERGRSLKQFGKTGFSSFFLRGPGGVGGVNWAQALCHVCRSIAAISWEVETTPPSSHCACILGVWWGENVEPVRFLVMQSFITTPWGRTPDSKSAELAPVAPGLEL